MAERRRKKKNKSKRLCAARSLKGALFFGFVSTQRACSGGVPVLDAIAHGDGAAGLAGLVVLVVVVATHVSFSLTLGLLLVFHRNKGSVCFGDGGAL